MPIGKQFEAIVKRDAELNGVTCIRVPDEIINFYNKQKAVQVKTEFDFCLGIDGLAVFLDAKATKENVLNFKSKLTNQKKIHQLVNLTAAYEKGNIAGLLIWFYQKENYAWASVESILDLISSGKRGISYDSPGIVTQLDSVPIDFRQLMFNDIDKQTMMVSNRSCNAKEI